MGTKLIIIEGMDNTGKSTLINQYIRVVEGLNSEAKVEVIHMEKPPQELITKTVSTFPGTTYTQTKSYNYDKVNEFSHNAYMSLPTKLYEIKLRNDSPDIIILDRAWLSEYVYSYLYRNRNRSDVIRDNLIIEKKVMNIFGEDNVHLIYLYPENLKFIKYHEDGKSLAVLRAKEVWPEDRESEKRFIDRRIKEELTMFDEAFNDISIIKHKTPIQVNKTGSESEFRNSILTEIFEAIHG